MKIKTLICNCKGLAPFRFADMNSLAFEIESELDVSYAAIHPELCAEEGTQFLADVLRAAEDDPDTYVMVCACAEDTQRKLFKRVLRNSNLEPSHFVPVDASEMTNDGILDRIRKRLEALDDPARPRH